MVCVITLLLISISASVLFAPSAFSQAPCVKFKHVEFFISTELNLPNWSESDVAEGVAANLKATERPTFAIPFIIKQLADYEPACGRMTVDRRFELLIELYSVIRPDAHLKPGWPTREKLELIRKDFYTQLHDDREFRDLVYSMDDGPLTGKLTSISAVKALNSREFQTQFGKMRFGNTSKGVAVIAIDNKGKSIWSRVLGGVVPTRTLREADLKSLTVELTDFVIVARLFVDGEQLTVYTRPNGRFMYYTH